MLRLLAATLLCGLAWPASSLLAQPPSASPESRGSQTSSVLIVSHEGATDAFEADRSVVRQMIVQGITRYLDAETEKGAWRTILSPDETVGLKVHSSPGPLVGTRTSVVESLVRSLLEAGIPSKQIIIWDKQASDLDKAGFTALGKRLGVPVKAAIDAGYSDEHNYPSSLLGRLIVTDSEFGKSDDNTGRRSYVTRLLTEELDKVINVTPLLSHGRVEIVGNLYNLALGSVDNTIRFQGEASRLARAVPEIYAMRAVGDKVVLNIVDALIAQYVGGQATLLHYAQMVNEIRFSRDPVALDRLSIETIRSLRTGHGLPQRDPHETLYENAALLELGVNAPDRILVETLNLDTSPSP